MTISQGYELSPVAIRRQLARILESRDFSRANYLCRFLEVCVEETLVGNCGQLKELWLGGAVFGRNGDFDPACNPIVRVQAGRLRDKLGSFYADEGRHDLVRITMPVGSYIPMFSALPHRVRVSGALAILPLTSMEEGEAAARFADTVTADLTHALVELRNIEVVSRTSSLGYRGTTRDIREVGRELGAEFLVEGTVQLSAATHRICLQLTSAETGYHCWAGWFEQRTSKSCPDLKHIARLICDELGMGKDRSRFETAAYRAEIQ